MHTELLAYLFAVLFRDLQVPAAQQPVLKLVNQFSLKASKISTNPGIDISREICRRQETCRSRSQAFGYSRAPRRVAAQHTPSSVVEMEKSLRLCMESIQESTSTCWNFEQLSMGSYGVTVRMKHSFQRSPCNRFSGDLGSFGKRALRIAAPRAIGHEVQFA